MGLLLTVVDGCVGLLSTGMQLFRFSVEKMGYLRRRLKNPLHFPNDLHSILAD